MEYEQLMYTQSIIPVKTYKKQYSFTLARLLSKPRIQKQIPLTDIKELISKLKQTTHKKILLLLRKITVKLLI